MQDDAFEEGGPPPGPCEPLDPGAAAEEEAALEAELARELEEEDRFALEEDLATIDALPDDPEGFEGVSIDLAAPLGDDDGWGD